MTVNSNLFFKTTYYPFVLLFLVTLSAGLAAAPFEKGLLFRIEKQDYPVSYIFGSIHSGDPRVLDFSNKLLSALESTDQFVMEVKIDQGMIFQSITGMWLMDGKKLADVIGETLYQYVVETGERVGMPEATFTYMKPWVVMMLFSLPPGNYAQIVDIELMKIAQSLGNKLIGLESVQEQFDVFDKMSISDQKVLLENTLKNYPLLSKQYETLFDAYLDRDIGRLEQLAHEQMEQQADVVQVVKRLMQRLLDDRNQRMLTRLLPELSESANFIVVGALHLPGEHGLLELLEQQGFSVSVVE